MQKLLVFFIKKCQCILLIYAELFYLDLILWTGSFAVEGMSGCYIFTIFIEIPDLNEKCVDPDQTPHFGTSDLD